jgi:hypothetical protein
MMQSLGAPWAVGESLVAASLAASILRTAMSARESVPGSLATYSRRLDSMTEITYASSTTWAFVMMMPSGPTITPNPSNGTGFFTSGGCMPNCFYNCRSRFLSAAASCIVSDSLSSSQLASLR